MSGVHSVVVQFEMITCQCKCQKTSVFGLAFLLQGFCAVCLDCAVYMIEHTVAKKLMSDWGKMPSLCNSALEQ